MSRPSFDASSETAALTLVLARVAAALRNRGGTLSPATALLDALVRHIGSSAAGSAIARQAPPGLLIARGDVPAHVFVLAEGEAEVFTGDPTDRPLVTVTAPVLLGEIAHLAGGATADVRLRDPGALLIAIDRGEFDRFVRSEPDLWRVYQELVSGRLLQQLPHTRSVTPQIVRALLSVTLPAGGDTSQRRLLEKMAQAVLLDRPNLFGWRPFLPGERIIAEGDPLDSVFILFRGTAVVCKPGRPDILVGAGSILGEISALSGLEPTATVLAGEAGAEALVLARADFQRHVLGDAEARAHVRTLALARLREQYAAMPLDAHTEERLRTVRDQNTDALIRRHGIRVVAGEGVYRALNPDGRAVTIDGIHSGAIEQKYELLKAVERLFKSGCSAGEILETAHAVRARYATAGGAPDEVVRASIVNFVDYATHVHRVAFAEALERVPPRPATDPPAIVDRIARVRWLQDRLRADPLVDPARLPKRPLPDLVQEITTRPDPVRVMDEKFRELMETGVGEGSEQLFGELRSVMFQRIEMGSCEFDRRECAGDLGSACRENLRHLAVLRERLERGERSAIGGRLYPQQRFTAAVLDAIARGAITVLVYDGRAEAAEEYARTRYGSDPRTGTRWPGWTTQIQGLDGSGPRTLLTVKLPAGRTAQYLLIAGYGASRQLHNAGAILLYEDDDGRRVPTPQLELASEGLDYMRRMQEDIGAALGRQEELHEGRDILGVRAASVGDLPVQLLILQNPGEITRAWTDEVTIEPARGAMFRFFTGFMRQGGTLLRLVIPKVGGDGLYGDTAGLFVTAAFSACGSRLLPHVLFNGTAGGFAGTAGTGAFRHARGLGDIRPGGTIAPVETIEQVGSGAGPRLLRTLFGGAVIGPAAIPAQAVRGVDVNFTSHHASVAAPAVETYTLIEEELVSRGKASVDVEGGAIWHALEALGRTDVTFTPLYTHSDDPRTSRESPSDSLASMGPWFEGVEVDHGRYALLKALVERSASPAAAKRPGRSVQRR